MTRHACTLAVLALLLPTLAGCLGGGPVENDDAHGPTTAAGEAHEWPPLEEATIRPGIRVYSDRGQCTSNFVFTDARDASVYLGLAAHCVPGMDVGDGVRIDAGDATGTIAYSSWVTMAINRDPDDQTAGGDTCDNEPDAHVCNVNDFALIRVDDAHVGDVHPAVRHFGGPKDLADSTSVRDGDKVLSFGSSMLRPDGGPTSWHEGYVWDARDEWYTYAYTVTPGVPGDSGSGVMTGDGAALGVRVTLSVTHTPPGKNGITNLDKALEYAREHAGVDARLATWDLLEPGFLPGA